MLHTGTFTYSVCYLKTFLEMEILLCVPVEGAVFVDTVTVIH